MHEQFESQPSPLIVGGFGDERNISKFAHGGDAGFGGRFAAIACGRRWPF